ncbi:MAG: ABC transporter ATP-binding protein [Clostridiaceae bacterium]|jgi:branched-chain amino acid transport system ATP-binding protein|nr:ABC transporter ATP-binding protein [Clostridiaceae bacterium]
MLRSEKICVRFGGLVAVDHVSLTVEEGTIHAIIGPNGAGKTTFFNTISGAEKPAEGKVFFRDEDITGLPPHRIAEKGIGRTFQNIKLFNSMSVLENVLCGMHLNVRSNIVQDMLGMSFQRREERELLEKCESLLKQVGLYDKRDLKANNLPYGEQRKLEIVRAMATDASLLMLDEPAAGMNPTETRELMQFIRKINDEGLTILLIEHDVRMVMTLADKITVLDHGIKIAEGSAEDVRHDANVIEAYLGKSYRGAVDV